MKARIPIALAAVAAGISAIGWYWAASSSQAVAEPGVIEFGPVAAEVPVTDQTAGEVADRIIASAAADWARAGMEAEQLDALRVQAREVILAMMTRDYPRYRAVFAKAGLGINETFVDWDARLGSIHRQFGEETLPADRWRQMSGEERLEAIWSMPGLHHFNIAAADPDGVIAVANTDVMTASMAPEPGFGFVMRQSMFSPAYAAPTDKPRWKALINFPARIAHDSKDGPSGLLGLGFVYHAEMNHWTPTTLTWTYDARGGPPLLPALGLF